MRPDQLDRLARALQALAPALRPRPRRLRVDLVTVRWPRPDAPAGDAEIADVADEVILVPPCDPLLQPIVASLPLQLLAYYVADINGTDVDQPRNLAKSVTVE